MLYREWKVKESDPSAAAELEKWFAAKPGFEQGGKLLGRVLAAREFNTPELAEKLLDGHDALPDPFLIKDMDKAVERIIQAVQQDEAIAVFGDYDVDGITATALMYNWLVSQGATAYYKLPSRSDDDYGLSPTLVEQVAARGITLIITVDNGTTAFEAAGRAAELGVSLVVTDHHLPYDTLPQVDALINPCRSDDDSGLSLLSGVGVVFMLLAALEGCTPEELLEEYGDLVAIGTVADVMKLVGVNRTLVKTGMEVLHHTQRPGLRAMIEACGWDEKGVTVENISYGIAPRLNAAGRMDDATSALHLLLSEDEEEAAELVQELQQQNAARQKAEQEILDVVASQLELEPELQRSRVLVIWGDGWHQGVIGIVASRLVDRYAKPVIAISFEGDEGKGSGRSVSGFSLHSAIASCEDILLRYGGHDLAAGFSLKREHVVAFRRRINQWAVENNPVPLLPAIAADALTTLAEVTVDEVKSLGYLAPCGSGNPAPRFMVKNAIVDAIYPVSDGKHSRLRLRQGGVSIYAVLFSNRPEQLAYKPGDEVDVLMAFSLYDGKNGNMVSARIMEMRPAGMGNTHVAYCALFENFCAGAEPPHEQRQLLAPTREDTAWVYRQVRDNGGIYFGDLRPAFSRLGEEMTGRVLTALAALEELGLIERNADGGHYQVVSVAEKRNLADSVLLARLGT